MSEISRLIPSNFDVEDAVGPCCSCTVVCHTIITPRDWFPQNGGYCRFWTGLIHGGMFFFAATHLITTILELESVRDEWVISGIGVSLCTVGFFCNLARSVAQCSGFDKKTSRFQHAVTCSWGVSTALFVSAMITRRVLE
ncbi:MAG: hypothetical protein K1000chlam2_00714 [Chlamydiae bacterium]|nr:hypothetical protein [Chlamydiota bacterium]